MDKMRFGILATGKIAHKMANTIRGGEDAVLYAVASRNEEKAKAFALEFGAEKAYGSYEALLRDPKVDVVYVASPHSLHYPMVKQSLEYGKHVLVEKPIAVNYQQAEELFSLAREKGLFLMEGMWIKFLPGIQCVLDLIHKNAIGKVTGLTTQFSILRKPEYTPRQFYPELAGGALLDIGIYCLTLSSLIFGYVPVKTVSSCVKNRFGTDQQNAVVFTYAGGEQAALTSSLSADGGVTAIISGTKGRIVLPRFVSCQKVILQQTYETEVELPYVSRLGGFEYEVRHVVECIRANKLCSEVHTPQNTLAIMKQMDQLRKDWELIYPFE